MQEKAKSDLKMVASNKFVLACLYIAIGVLLCTFRATMLNWLLTIVGILMVAYGIFEIFKKNLTEGVVCIGIGAIVILAGWLFVEVAMIVFGVSIIIYGVLGLIDSLNAKNVKSIASSSITILLGILLSVGYWLMKDWFFAVLGILFVANGILMFSNTRKTTKKVAEKEETTTKKKSTKKTESKKDASTEKKTTARKSAKKTENEDVASAENDLVKKSENEEENKNS